MIDRLQKPVVERLLAQFPAVGLLGARQVGKTTLAKVISRERAGSVYLDLERPSDLNKLSDPELYLANQREKLVILDEVQRTPGLFRVLRSLVDDDRRPGRFLLLGSASPDLLKQSSESLAGRIAYHELSPFLLPELRRPAREWRRLWLRGGFPLSYLAVSDAASMDWRLAFIRTHLERDLPGLGIRVSAAALSRFWQMLAHSHGQQWNAARIAASLGVSAPTVAHYLDILEDTFMLRRLPPFHANLKKRLVKAPKVYLRDSGLLHALLALADQHDLHGHPVVGASFEGWALEQVLAAKPPTWRSSFYRTATGVELDLLLERPGRQGVLAVEFKYSSAPQPSKGFWQALADIKPVHAWIVAPVNEAYLLRKDVEVVPITGLDRILQR
jgi:hypothetical protein